MEFGVDPRAVDTMSLAEILEMMQRMVRKEKAPLPTDAEYEEMKQSWRDLNLPDVRIDDDNG